MDIIKRSANNDEYIVDLVELSNDIEVFIEQVCDLYQTHLNFTQDDLQKVSDAACELSDLQSDIESIVRDSFELDGSDERKLDEIKRNIIQTITDYQEATSSELDDIVRDFEVDLDDCNDQLKENRKFSKEIVLACSKHG
jgi:hypothetical protein